MIGSRPINSQRVSSSVMSVIRWFVARFRNWALLTGRNGRACSACREWACGSRSMDPRTVSHVESARLHRQSTRAYSACGNGEHHLALAPNRIAHRHRKVPCRACPTRCVGYARSGRFQKHRELETISDYGPPPHIAGLFRSRRIGVSRSKSYPVPWIVVMSPNSPPLSCRSGPAL